MDNYETKETTMRPRQLSKRLALGAGALGMVLTGGGVATAALSAIQPVGALTAQVPAVAVREQNVNSAGRIRVALPKNGVGVNGSVSVNNFPTSMSVNNLPVNAAGRLRTQPAAAASQVPDHFYTSVNLNNSSATPVDLTGSGKLRACEVEGQGGPQVNVAVLVDGAIVWNASTSGGCCWASTPDFGWTTGGGGQPVTWYAPPGGISFQHSLQIVVSSSSNVTAGVRGIYTTAS
jgi:hypothetical protein